MKMQHRKLRVYLFGEIYALVDYTTKKAVSAFVEENRPLPKKKKTFDHHNVFWISIRSIDQSITLAK